MNRKIILDLCGGTGSWSKPYKEAGYDVRLITLPGHNVLNYEPPESVHGVLAAPPCTEYSIVNRDKYISSQCFFDFDKYKNSINVDVLNACLEIIEKCNPVFYAVENPCGLMRKYLGRPQFSFQPYQFGDGWTKKTDIWGKFNSPVVTHTWDTCPKINLYTRPNRKRPCITFCHKSAKTLIPQFNGFEADSDAAFRAITPPGFAKSFFGANR